MATLGCWRQLDTAGLKKRKSFTTKTLRHKEEKEMKELPSIFYILCVIEPLSLISPYSSHLRVFVVGFSPGPFLRM
jgi:hypothetical protein